MIWGCLLGLTLGAGTLAASAAEPPEFQRVDSEHFTVYSEAFYPPEGLLNELEGLHAKVSLDLVLFSPWAKDAKIELYLYKSSDSYRAQPGVRPWTAAQVDLARRRISAFQSPDLRRILAHELGHLFFDDFFLAASSGSAAGHAPRWLTEGVAVNMEWDYGLDQDRPFDPERAAKRMRPLPEFLAFDYQDDAHEARSVSDWYIQAYSLVRFLMRRFPGGLFFDLCDGLRRGLPLEEALRRAYGTAFPDLTMLERRWREDLKGG